MRAGGSKAATMIKQSALAPSPQPRPAPTARALPSGLIAQGGQNWTPIGGQIWTPIDRMTTESVTRSVGFLSFWRDRRRIPSLDAKVRTLPLVEPIAFAISAAELPLRANL